MPHPVYLSPINAPLPSAESQDKYHGLLSKGERGRGAYLYVDIFLLFFLYEIHSELPNFFRGGEGS